MGGMIVGIVLILIGISTITGVNFFNFFVAIILIAIGIRMIIRRSTRNAWRWDDYYAGHHHGETSVSSEDRVNEVIVFSPLNKKVISEHFAGGKVVMVFSGGELDLTQAKTDRTEIDLEVSSVFSSIEIIIPKEWKVRSGVNVFLGHVDTHQAQSGEGNVTLVLRGNAVFGEIEVRN